MFSCSGHKKLYFYMYFFRPQPNFLVDAFLAYPAFRPKMSLCHRVARFLSDFNSVWFV